MLATIPLTSALCGLVMTLAIAAPARAADVTVSISNFTFVPAAMTVAPGTTVVFSNGDDTPHSVVADDGSFHSQALDTGDKFSFKFTKVGVVSYHCGLHPFMQGKIIVK